MKRLFFLFAVFTLGFILGAAMAGILIGKQIDALYIENRSLKDQLLVNEKEIKELKENNQTKNNRIITKISAKTSFTEKCDYSDYEKSTIKLTVEKKVREWLEVIMGQEVETVNYLLVPGIIDNREVEVEGHKMRLKVGIVVIAENVIIYLEIIPVKNSA